MDGPIMPGDLVMRTPLNRKTKLHPKWDGPFVVLASTDTDVYQLATANGHILNNLVNQVRIRKLKLDEVDNYRDEFWEASERLKVQDKQAQRRQQHQDPEVRPQDRKRGRPNPKRTLPKPSPVLVSYTTCSGRIVHLPSRFPN